MTHKFPKRGIPFALDVMRYVPLIPKEMIAGNGPMKKSALNVINSIPKKTPKYFQTDMI
jgi:hypothetical protein